jgi:hypothetical protein
MRAEGEACEENRFVQVDFHPVERGADVVLLALAFVEGAFAEAYAAEVKSEDGES